MKITNNQQLALSLLAKGLKVAEFDYVEGKTTEGYVTDHPTVYHGRRFYENPYLWATILDMDFTEAINYLYGLKELVYDTVVIKGALTTRNIDSKIPLKMVERYIKVAKSDLDPIDSEFEVTKNVEEETKAIQQNVDSILEYLASLGNEDWFKKVVAMAETNGVEPLYGGYGNAGNGMALYASTTEGVLIGNPNGDSFANYLLDNGAKPASYDSLPFCMACKHRAYSLAVRMLDSGADIHTKGDLGLRMVKRNDSNGIKLSEKEESARKILLDRYAAEKDKNETDED